MELSIRVPMPRAAPPNGVKTALYSTRPQPSPADGTGRPTDAGPIQSGERLMKRIRGWLKVNQAGTFFVESWDAANAQWITLNGGGSGVAITSGTPFLIDEVIQPGEFQLSATFATSPTTWDHSKFQLTPTADT